MRYMKDFPSELVLLHRSFRTRGSGKTDIDRPGLLRSELRSRRILIVEQTNR